MTSFHTVRKQLRVQTHSSSSSSFFFFFSSFYHGCPSPGPLVFQIQAGAPSLRLTGPFFRCPCPPQRRAVGEEHLCSLLRVWSSFLQDLLSWFTSLFLFWGRISASVSKHKRKEKKQHVKTSSSSRWVRRNNTVLMVDVLPWCSGIYD